MICFNDLSEDELRDKAKDLLASYHNHLTLDSQRQFDAFRENQDLLVNVVIFAIINQDLELMMQAIQDNYFDPNREFDNSRNLMHYLAQPSNITPAILNFVNQHAIDIARVLIARQPDIVNSLSDDNLTPLQIAVTENYLDLARLLIEHGAIIHHADVSNRNDPIIVATLARNYEMLELLLNNNANVNIVNSLGHNLITQLIYTAIPEGMPLGTERRITQLLIDRDIDMNNDLYNHDIDHAQTARLLDHHEIFDALEQSSQAIFTDNTAKEDTATDICSIVLSTIFEYARLIYNFSFNLISNHFYMITNQHRETEDNQRIFNHHTTQVHQLNSSYDPNLQPPDDRVEEESLLSSLTVTEEASICDTTSEESIVSSLTFIGKASIFDATSNYLNK